MADSIDRVFVYALNTVKRIPRLGSARPPPAERLKLYGLYKQSMEGDVEGVMDRPRSLEAHHHQDATSPGGGGVNGTAAAATTNGVAPGERSAEEVKADQQKWDAWYAQRGISRTEAKRRYIATLIETMRVYASQTADARELVSELEFVWDQIKSNPATSSERSSSRRSHSNSNPNSSHGRQNGSTQSSDPQIYPVMSERGARNPRGENMNGKRGRDIDAKETDDRGLRVLSPMSQPDGPGELEDYGEEDDDDDDEEMEGRGTDEEAEGMERDAFVDAPDSQMADDDRGSPPSSSHSNHRPGPEEGQPGQQNPLSAMIEPIAKYIQKQMRPRPSDPDANATAKWQRRIETALVKMNAEMAALREQLDMQAHDGRSMSVYSSIVHPFSSSRSARRGRGGVLGWILDTLAGLTSTLVKHLVIDAVLLCLITLWMHYRRIPLERLEEWVIGWIRRVQALAVFKNLERIRKGESNIGVSRSLKKLALGSR